MNKFNIVNEFEVQCRESWGEAVMEAEKCPEYAQVRKREDELTEILYKKLDNYDMLNELIDNITDFPDIQKLAVYKQAMRDCIALLNWLGLLSIGGIEHKSED